MTPNIVKHICSKISRHKIPIFILCLFAVSLWGHSSERNSIPNTQIDTTRTVLSTQKQDSQKVVLEYADELLYNQYTTPDFQKLRGNVRFRRGGMYMYCDSAYFYEKKNAMDAYGNVRMEQGDTLFVFSDTLYYDGNTSMARLRKNVILQNREVTLYTDSLNYDQNMNVGYYYTGGEIDDKKNNLKSVYGEYSTDTKDAKFFFNVVLTGDGVKMYTDSLKYNTDTKIVDISSPTEIVSDSGLILSSLGWYNTVTDRATLYRRSTVINGSNKLTGDTIFYDKVLGKGEVFGNMHLNDTAQHLSIKGNYGYYYNSPERAMVVDSAQMIEASQQDTLYLHADTLRLLSVADSTKLNSKINSSIKPITKQVTEVTDSNLDNNKKDNKSHRGDRHHRHSHGDVECDEHCEHSEDNSADVDTPKLSLKERRKLRKLQKASDKDDMIVDVADSLSLKQLDTTLTKSGVGRGSRRRLTTAVDSSITKLDSTKLIYSAKLDTTIGDTTMVKKGVSLLKVVPTNAADTAVSVITLDSIVHPLDSTLMPKDSLKTDSVNIMQRVVKAYNNTRFFRKDVQGVCDSLVYTQADSLITLFDNPVIWSGAKQILGDTIMIYLNDTTIDRVFIPSYPFVIQQKDTAFFDQISGKELTAYFIDGALDKVDVSGNVQTIFYPQEEDSTFMGLNNAVSSYLQLIVNRETNEMKSLSMWPKVDGSLTPIKMIKAKDLYLPSFKWIKGVRPQSPQDIFRKVDKVVTTENKPRRRFSTEIEE